jgi:hypothetical protein
MTAEPDDGQLHTLGLLERLRSEANLVRGAYGGLYERVDKLLREIENPNRNVIRLVDGVAAARPSRVVRRTRRGF